MSNFLPVMLLLIVILFATAVTMWRGRAVTIIYPPMVGLLYRDGRFAQELPPGRYARLDPLKRVKVVKVSLAEVPVTMPEVTVLSKDQFSFRLSLFPVMKVVDARTYLESQSPSDLNPLTQFLPTTGIHPTLQPFVAASALEAAGTRTLAEIMATPAALTSEILARVENAVPGAIVGRVLVAAINLPPETRKMFTDVERTKMEAQSALERARGEQAALRVLANAARLVSDNPALGNLRLLQAIEATKGSTTIILGESATTSLGAGPKPVPPA